MHFDEGCVGKITIPTEMVNAFCEIVQDFYANPINLANCELWDQTKELEMEQTQQGSD